MEKLNINQWAEEDRPREKMASLGTEALSNAELLAILIGSGSTKESAVDLMKHILADCNNNLNTLGKMTIRELCQYNGIGEANSRRLRIGQASPGRNTRRTARLGNSHPHLQPHATRHARPRHRRVLGTVAKPALPSHQESAHLAWGHHGDGRRHPYHHEGGCPRQLYHPRRLPQPSLR